MLPSPAEIEQCLQEAADCQQEEIARLCREREAALEGNAAAGEISGLIVQAARRLELLNGDVLRTVLILDTFTGEQESFAVVSGGGGRCVSVSGCDVQLVSAETPAGQAMLRCQVGDSLSLGQVAAVDSQPTRRQEAKQDSQAARVQEAASHRQARLDEKQRQAAAREEAECRDQEAFDLRAAAYFQRCQEVAAKNPPASAASQTKKAGKQTDGQLF